MFIEVYRDLTYSKGSSDAHDVAPERPCRGRASLSPWDPPTGPLHPLEHRSTRLPPPSPPSRAAATTRIRRPAIGVVLGELEREIRRALVDLELGYEVDRRGPLFPMQVPFGAPSRCSDCSEHPPGTVFRNIPIGPHSLFCIS